MNHRFAAFALAILLGTVACGDDTPPAPPTLGTFCGNPVVACNAGETCTTPGERINSAICSHACTSDADCTPTADDSYPLVCGRGPDGSSVCLPRCDVTSGDEVICVDGQSVACAGTDGSQCESCGCPSAAPRCEAGVGCMPPSEVGGACTHDDHCVSSNCSVYAEVCRAPVGAPCTTDDCDLCRTWASGSACSRRCTTAADCDGDLCLGNASAEYFVCRPTCSGVGDPSCPGTCMYPRESTAQLYCECDGFVCPALTAPRPVGTECNYPSQCASEVCLQSRWEGSGGTWYEELGLCTAPCTSDSECGGAMVCMATMRGGFCVPTCTVGIGSACGEHYEFCTPTRTVSGATVAACNPLAADGGRCVSFADCRSQRCTSNRCVP